MKRFGEKMVPTAAKQALDKYATNMASFCLVAFLFIFFLASMLDELSSTYEHQMQPIPTKNVSNIETFVTAVLSIFATKEHVYTKLS